MSKIIDQTPNLRRQTIWLMAITGGAGVANLYYNQPLLELIQQKLHASTHIIGLIPMLTQVGYALGILFIVPLGDLIEKRSLIVTMLGLTAVALAAAALSVNLNWLLIASLAIGITTITPQLIVPFAAQLAKPQNRGKVVGMVMSGLFIGILLARTVSGFVGGSFGWRTIYWLGSVFMVTLAIILYKSLPLSKPSLKISYVDLMKSLLELIPKRVLQEAGLSGAMSFGAFSAFWSTLAFLLALPPYHYGSEVAGLFGLVGVVGAMAAPIVGKFADKGSPKQTVGLGLLISTLSFIIFWAFGHQLIGLIVGVILLDLGAQTTLVSNQTRIYSLPVELHSRLNALYITFYFVGGALGSFLGTYSWSQWRWQGVCVVALIMLFIGLTTFLPRTGLKHEST